MNPYFAFNSAGTKVRGAFINTSKEACSIYESGRMVYSCLKDRQNYLIDYFSIDQIDLHVLVQTGQVVRLDGHPVEQDFDFWVFNWHFYTMETKLTLKQIACLRGIKFAILLELEPENPLHYVKHDIFDGYIALDPAAEATKKIFPFARPLEGTARHARPIRDVPVISSFGFGTPAKGFEQVIAAVNKEFERAIVRINIPAGAHTGGMDMIHNTNYPRYLERMCKSIANTGIDVQFTYDFLSPDQLVDWCSDSDLNCFLYTRRQPGLSATTDQAIISGQPLITGTNDTFRHIHRYIQPYPLLSLREALTITPPLVRRLQEDWSSDGFSRTFERMLHAYGLGQSDSIAELGAKQPSLAARRLLILTSRDLEARGILNYETRLANCLGRCGTFSVSIATATSAAERAAAIKADQHFAVLILGEGGLPKTFSPAFEGSILHVTEDMQNAVVSDGRLVERLPIIPYYTVTTYGPKQPRIYLLGFTADDSLLDHIAARVAAEFENADILVEVPASAPAEFEATLAIIEARHGYGLRVQAVSTPADGDEAIKACGESTLIVAYCDPGRTEELEDLVSLALATERAVMFTEAALFPKFPAQGNTIEHCGSLRERIEAGVAGQIDLSSRFAEGETYARFHRLVSSAEAAQPETIETVDASTLREDGSDPVSAAALHDPELYVKAAYYRMLGRVPERGGLEDHVRALQAGMSPSELLGSMLLQQEGRAYAALVSDHVVPGEIDAAEPETFVRAAYLATLGREADEGGLAHWSQKIVAGEPRTKILGDLLLSPEGVRRHTHLMKLWGERKEQERRAEDALRPLPQARGELTEPPVDWFELATRQGGDFIHALYWLLLRRSPDPDGFAGWAARLEGGESKAEIAGELLISLEARGQFHTHWPAFVVKLEELLPLLDVGFTAAAYRLFQGRVPGAEVLALVTARLQSGLSRSGLLGELLLSAEGLARLSTRNLEEAAPAAGSISRSHLLVETCEERRIFVLTAATDRADKIGFSSFQQQLIATLVEQQEAVRLVRWSPSERRVVMLSREAVLSLGTDAAFRLCAARHPAQGEAVHIDVAGPSRDWLLVAGSIRLVPEAEYLHEMNVVVEARRLGLSIAFIFAGAPALRRSVLAEAQAEELAMQAMMLADFVLPVSALARNDAVVFLKRYQGADVGPQIEKIKAPRAGDIGAWPLYVRKLRGLLTGTRNQASRLGQLYVAKMHDEQNVDRDGVRLVETLADLGGDVVPVEWASHELVALGETAHKSIKCGYGAAWLLITAASLVVIDNWDAVFAFAARKELRIAALLPAARLDDERYRVLLRFDRVFAPTKLSFEHLRSYLQGTRERLTCAEDRFKHIERPHDWRPIAAKSRDNAETTALFVTDGNTDAVALARKVAQVFKGELKVTFCSVGAYKTPMEGEAHADNIGLSVDRGSDVAGCLASQYDFAVVLVSGPAGFLVTSGLAASGTPILLDRGSDLSEVEQAGVAMVDIEDSARLADLLSLFADPDWRSLVRNEGLNRQPRTWTAYASDIIADLVAEEPRNVANVLPKSIADIAQVMPFLDRRPKLSICISTYKRADWVDLSLRNIFQQIEGERDDIEVLVVDNESPDHTAQVVEPFLKRRDFRYYRNPRNVGMLGNLAVTAQRARGSHIWILGDDDLIRPGAIERVLQVIDAHPRVGLIYLNYGYSSEGNPTSITDLDAYLANFNVLEPKGPDHYVPIRSIAAKCENFFTAIYAIVFRRDHALRAYCQDTSGRTFSTMASCIPTAKYVFEWMMDDDGYWIGNQCMVVNSNVSWAAYAPLFDLEHLPRCWDLAEWKGSPAADVDKRRTNRLWLVEMMWRELFENDNVNNAAYVDVERIVNRLKHLPEFAERLPSLRAIYEKAYVGHAAAAKLPPHELFRAFSSPTQSTTGADGSSISYTAS